VPGGPISSAALSDTNHGHLLTDNLIFDYGKRVGHGSGVWFFQAGRTRVSHNLVQEGPRDAFGIYGVRFGNGKVLPASLYGQTLDFWSSLDVLHTRLIEIDHNTVANVVRDTADAGALEYWGVGVNNTACVSRGTRCFCIGLFCAGNVVVLLLLTDNIFYCSVLMPQF